MMQEIMSQSCLSELQRHRRVLKRQDKRNVEKKRGCLDAHAGANFGTAAIIFVGSERLHLLVEFTTKTPDTTDKIVSRIRILCNSRMLVPISHCVVDWRGET